MFRENPLYYALLLCALLLCALLLCALLLCALLGDHTLRLWDANQPIPCCMVVPAHSSEVLTCDWNKYEEVGHPLMIAGHPL